MSFQGSATAAASCAQRSRRKLALVLGQHSKPSRHLAWFIERTGGHSVDSHFVTFHKSNRLGVTHSREQACCTFIACGAQAQPRRSHHAVAADLPNIKTGNSSACTRKAADARTRIQLHKQREQRPHLTRHSQKQPSNRLFADFTDSQTQQQRGRHGDAGGELHGGPGGPVRRLRGV